ncbi:MAG: lipid kinase YegS [Bradymonadaceae bacterium]|nr:lipid kinase YegS [Lujinxingiaceae bacterium]
MHLRLLLNGKSCDRDDVREAVALAREQGVVIEVRVLWEDGDTLRYTQEAAAAGVQRLVAAGGDGTLNEVVNALMQLDDAQRPILGVLPLGTANDFATACAVPASLFAALMIAAKSPPRPIDVLQINERYCLNVASIGFGAEVTANTPAELKAAFGGAAYALMAAAMALNFQPKRVAVSMDAFCEPVIAVVPCIANGRLAGGGKLVAPNALLDDGLLDVFVVHRFELQDVAGLIQDLRDLSSEGEFVSYHQAPWIEIDSAELFAVNLDGEPICEQTLRAQVVGHAIRFAAPPDCPLLSPTT